MGSIIDYAEEYGCYTFAEKPFNAVDSLILSQLTYLSFDDSVSSFEENQESRRLADIPGFMNDFRGFYSAFNFNLDAIKLLFLAVISSVRYKNIRLNFYEHKTDPQEEKQFATVCFFLNERDAYLGFRGTDSTIVGWKEDFNMAFMDEIPSQLEARKYLEMVEQKISGSIMIGGHSKGGNLAVYAAVKCCETCRKKISAVYNHDGPGFSQAFLLSPEFKSVAGRIRTIMPASALVGLILQQHDEYKVVECSNFGLFHHDAFSWSVKGDNFEYAKSVSFSSAVTRETINRWLAALDTEKRRRFVETLYDIVKSTNAETLGDLKDNWKESTVSIFKYTRELDSDTRKFLLHTVKLIALYSVKSVLPHKTVLQKK